MITFADLGLPDALVERTRALGFEEPTEIQQQAIPPLLLGHDVVGVAQTGTGKTAAFGLPLLTKIDPDSPTVQSLVLAPTRELAIQVAEAIEEFAEEKIRTLAIYGGAPYGPQLGGLRDGAHIVVGTPGRVIDMLSRGALNLHDLAYLVLDEADEMLRMGFADDVEEILSEANPDRQTALFSATMPHAIRAVAREHMVDPVELTVSPESSTIDTITQEYAIVPFRHKVGALYRVLATTDSPGSIVFVRTRKDAEEVGAELIARGLNAATISGDVQQKERERIVDRLRAGTLDVLVATDVAARGLDVDRIGLVVNFDVPREVDAYVHRIGRTGRAGREGRALTFFTPKENNRLRNIERVTNSRLQEVEIPSPRDVSLHRANKVLDGVKERIERGRLESYKEQLGTFALESAIDSDDLAAALLAIAVGDEGPRARDDEFSAEFDRRGRDRDDRRDNDFRRGFGGRERRDRVSGPQAGFTSYRVEVGHRHGARPGGIVGAIANEGGISGSELGRIKIFDNFALVDIATELTSEQLDRLRNTEVGGNPLRISVDTGPQRGGGDDRPRRGYRRDFGGSRGGRRGFEGPRGSDRRPRQFGRPKKRS